MASKHTRRKRSIDISKLTTEQANKLSEQIGKEIAKIMDQANESCNKMLGIYGMQTQIAYQITEKTKEDTVNKKQAKL